MPSKFRVRNFKEGGFYHIYNKGLDKQDLFRSPEDFEAFLYYLEIYLLKQEKAASKPKLPKRLRLKNLSDQVELISFCLLPNHLHLVLRSLTAPAIPKLLKQLANAYTFYFNKKYNHSGPTFQGRYRSVKVDPENLSLLTLFLHLHPGIDWLSGNPKNYSYSSFKLYLDPKSELIQKQYILGNFSSLQEFEKANLNVKTLNQNLGLIKEVLLEN